MKSTVWSANVATYRPLIRVGNRFIDLSEPVIMGIMNLTPDSFFDGGRLKSAKSVLKQAGKMILDGAVILDLGAVSSRPGAAMVSEKTELKRLIPALELIRSRYPECILSVDTWRSAVAEQAHRAGASMVNDISAGTFDKRMFATVAKLEMPYIMMHMKGKPKTMQENPRYKDVVSEVYKFLGERLTRAKRAGITDVIVDPGFGFGKTVSHNYQLLRSLHVFTHLNAPVLAGLSRKSMICKVLGTEPARALNGTTALHMLALRHGTSILRVHDVKEAVECVRLFREYNKA
jgi:dihydropteroate synthase